MIRALIVDDHAILRHGLRALLSDAFEGVECGEAGNFDEAMDQLRKQEWDVALLDITMPGKSGLELLRELKIEWPKLPVLVLSVHPADQFAVRVRKAGGEGYMTKESAPEELVKAIRIILAGGEYVCPELGERLAAAQPQPGSWLLENGPAEMELVLRAIRCHPAAPEFVARDYALLLLSSDGAIADWSPGAEHIFGYTSAEGRGQYLSLLYTAEDGLNIWLREELARAETGGHFASEGWCVRKDGTRFWASVVTMALHENESLRGYARVVRDFTGRRERDQALLAARTVPRPLPVETAVAGIISGEYDRIPEANDTFLELVGYTREDLLSGQLHWSSLTPPEYAPVVQLAHEEALRFGACTPFEKELICKDGTRVPVLVATAIVKISPFRWITFVQDLRGSAPNEKLDDEDTATDSFVEIVGRSASLKRLLRQVEVVAPTNATVLILGETGTGKELVARAVHRLSPRRDRTFISLNCAAIPTGLLESELFGYERGAFTGALTQKIGRFEMAHRGTLFLDEVGDIPLDLQPKLLRALQEKSFERLGGTKTIPIDVRLVAATNRNLTQMMGDKLFRSDLYYRLKVFPITTPALRDHAEDIPLLVRHFVKKYASQMDRQIDSIPPEMMKALVSWSWPGNVRELENFIERAVILSRGSHLSAPLDDIQPDASEPQGPSALEQVERDHIVKVLQEADGVVIRAAARLGMSRAKLEDVMRRLAIPAATQLTRS
jgi:formate hydrogenlyase transcriptional activator